MDHTSSSTAGATPLSSPSIFGLLIVLILYYSRTDSLLKKLRLPPFSVAARILFPIFKFVFVPFYLMQRWIFALTPHVNDDEEATKELICRNESRGILSEIETFVYYSLSKLRLTIPAVILNDVLGVILLYTFARCFCLMLFCMGPISIEGITSAVMNVLFEFAKKTVPFVQRKLATEEQKMKLEFEKELKDPTRTITTTLPKDGRPHNIIYEEMKVKAQAENECWSNGRVSGCVYSGEADHITLLNSTYSLYSISNPLHADIWPSVSQYEGEVCAMTANMLHGDAETCGFVSSGGSESIFLAVKAHKAFYRRTRTCPEIVACTTAHAALQKACDVLGVRLVQLRPDPVSFTLRPCDVERHVSAQTILIYASAPSYPQGTIDPIERLGEIAERHRVGLHVDACLGGFILPFARKLGYDYIPKFDFEVPGVTSMSCDTHKYGYACKGTSVLLYRNKELRHAQYFCHPDWTGGLYVTPSLAGSRPGGLIASTWASLHAMGESGYLTRTRKIMETTQYVANNLPGGVHLLGSVASDGTVDKPLPQAMVVCIASRTFNIYDVADAMKRKSKWNLNSLQNPACVHLCVTVKTNGEEFVRDLNKVVEELIMRKEDGEKSKSGGSAAVYGMAGSLPAGPVNEILKCYMDVTLSP